MRPTKKSMYSRSPRSRDALTRQIYFNQIQPPRILHTCTSKIRFSHSQSQPSNKSMWQLLRENKQLATSINQQQKQMMVLNSQQKKLLKKIKQFKEKNIHHNNLSQSSCDDSQKLRQSTCSKPSITRTNTSSSLIRHSDKDIHQSQKKNRIDGLKRQKQLIKAIILQNKLKYLAQKKSFVHQWHQKKCFLKDQANMIKYLSDYKLKKQKEKQKLKYQQIQLKSKMKYMNLVNKRNDKFNKVQELKMMTLVLDQFTEFDQKQNKSFKV